MEQVLLTDEGLEAIANKIEAKVGIPPNPIRLVTMKEVAQAQLKNVAEWGIEQCPHWHMYPDAGVIKRDCSQCWQVLRKEAGLEE